MLESVAFNLFDLLDRLELFSTTVFLSLESKRYRLRSNYFVLGTILAKWCTLRHLVGLSDAIIS